MKANSPTPRDFGEFVYCGLKWLLDKKYDRKSSQVPFNERAFNRIVGKNNEHRCIDWVLNHFKRDKTLIIFDGTKHGDQRLLPIYVNKIGITMNGKPDLILDLNGRIYLFEFKLVEEMRYLDLSEFKSNHAQIWCYKFLKDFNIDDYYLLRYFRDPNEKHTTSYRHYGRPYRLTQLTPLDLNDEKYLGLFSQYIQVMNSLANRDGLIIQRLILDHSPKNKLDEIPKCTNCIYNKKFLVCPAHH
ncbi:hypothetical protein N6H14_16335 [Paenibacillus sp. CC-CFT747]|nr:hypothetical protein N6H14_16335 [Paenibacillus sp. CC-CFT747]